MAGIVYLRTNHFEVKLEGITFKAKDFGRLCTEDFLFPEGKIWVQPPIVGIDIMRHPRDPDILLVILCFGVGCVILRFHSGAALPEPIHRFFADKRIQFVGFGIPEKSDFFPFEELGLTKERTDIGYLAAELFNNPKYIKSDLGGLARKILGIKRMFGLTPVSFFERHEQIKSVVCQLFITTVIAMSLFSTGEKIKVEECSTKKSSFLKNLSSLPLLTEGWLKLLKGRKGEKIGSPERGNNLGFQTTENDHMFLYSRCLKSKNKKGYSRNDLTHIRSMESSDDSFHSNGGKEYAYSDDDAWNRDQDVSVDDIRGGDDNLGGGKDTAENDDSNEATCRKPLKGILKCPSSNVEVGSPPSGAGSSPSTPKVQSSGQGPCRRANSKRHKVTFKFY